MKGLIECLLFCVSAWSRILACREILTTGSGSNWPHSTALCCFIYKTYKNKKDGQNQIFQKIYQNEPQEQHAEEKMLAIEPDSDFISTIKDKNAVHDIVLVLSYSPCYSCANKLIVFYEKYKNPYSISSFKIRFSQLYKIYGRIPKEEKEKNKKGLKDMLLAGITLETMTDKHWFDLFSRMVFGVNPDSCRIRDNSMERKLDTLKKEAEAAAEVDVDTDADRASDADADTEEEEDLQTMMHTMVLTDEADG